MATCWLLKVRNAGFGDAWPTAHPTAQEPLFQFSSSEEKPVHGDTTGNLQGMQKTSLLLIYRGLEVFIRGFMRSQTKPHTAMNICPSGAETLSEPQRSRAFSSCFSAFWIGNRRKNSFCAFSHQYKKISVFVLSITHFWHWHFSLLLFSHYSCWSSLCRDIKGRTGCGKLNCLDLPSAWCYPPAVNKNIAETFTAEQAFYFLLIELQKEKRVR